VVADAHAAVNNIKPLSVAMEKPEWIQFALSYKYKVIRIAAGSKRVCGCVKQSA
jgi:hypothetical protein